MGEVSGYEAKRALDRELENFRAKVSNRLETKIGRWFAILGIAGCLAVYNPHGIGGYLSALARALIPALIIGAIGAGIGRLLVSIIWKEQIALERERLLEKYPAARHTPPR